MTIKRVFEGAVSSGGDCTGVSNVENASSSSTTERICNIGLHIPVLEKEKDFAQLLRSDEVLLHMQIVSNSKVRWQAGVRNGSSLTHLASDESKEQVFGKLLKHELEFYFRLDDHRLIIDSNEASGGFTPQQVADSIERELEQLETSEVQSHESRVIKPDSNGMLVASGCSIDSMFKTLRKDKKAYGKVHEGHHWIAESLGDEAIRLRSLPSAVSEAATVQSRDNVLQMNLLEENLDRWVSQVSTLVGLRRLEARNSIDWSQRHLLLQADGALHSLPWDLLPFDEKNRTVFECVGGFSQVISLPLRASLESMQVPKRDGIPRILGAYHLCDTEWTQLTGFKDFHASLESRFVKNWCVDGLANASHFKASIDNITSLLNSPELNYRLAVIGGHGDGLEHGVRMLDNKLFTGRGTDFRNLVGLIAISCSLGQMESVRPGEMSGFYVELACHGLRRLLAARWPIPDTLACDFASEVLEKWTEYALQDEPVDGCYAKAVRDTQLKWFDEYKDDPDKNAGKRFTAMAFTHFGCR